MKRSFLIPYFLLALSLSSLCLLSSKISPVYASNEQILNGSFEDYIWYGGLNYTFDDWTNSYQGWLISINSPHSGLLNLWGYSSNCEINQSFPIPINVNTVSDFGFWARGEDDSGGLVVSITYGLDWEEGMEGQSVEWHNVGSNPSAWYYLDLTPDILGFTGILDVKIGYQNSYYSMEMDDVTLIGDLILSTVSTGLNTFWQNDYSREEINFVPEFYVDTLSIPDNDLMQICRIVNPTLTNLSFEAFLFKNSSGLYIYAQNGDTNGTALIYMGMWTQISYTAYNVGSVGDYDLTIECSTTSSDNSSITLFSYVIPHYVSGSVFIFQEMGVWTSTATYYSIFWDDVTFYLLGGLTETIDEFEGSYYPVGWNTTGTVILTEERSLSSTHSLLIEPSSISLDIQGDPELNYDFLMNGSAYTTPYSNSNFTSGNITLENSSPSLTVGHFIYSFSSWLVNGTTNITSSSFTIDIGGNTTISLVFSKAIMDIAFDPRNVASEIVHLADTGSQLGKMLGVNSFIGGLIMSAIICGIFLFPVMIFKRTLLPMAIMGFLGLAISTGLGFLPFWIDLVLLLIISVLFSGKIRDFITGAGH